MKLTTNRSFFFILAALFFINVLQSHFTELIFDEAYYWYYAQNLAWGYFDHPPMVALLIEVSSWFFKGELGVRFMSCVLSAGTLVLVWLMVDDSRKQKYVPHFFALAFSMTLLNAYGFFTLPDTPLLFFTALFLLLYKHFLRKETLALALGLGLAMAGLMYSKYHAVLVILFVFLSNLRLLRSRFAWLAVFFALLSYIPHFLWLYENEFISVRYHLFERPNRGYDFNDFTLGYFINLIALFGLTFPWIYYSLFRTRPNNLFNRALLFLAYGVLLFFFVSSFQRRVQTQWIIVICIPILYIAFNYLLSHDVYRKWIWRMALVNVAILLFLRLGLAYPPLFPIVFETHGNKEWVNEISKQAGNIPVIFENSYREAPMYSFYSGHTSFSLNNIYYRGNQYDIDGSEGKVQGKKVLYIAKRFDGGDMSYTVANGERYYGRLMQDFESFRGLATRPVVPTNPIENDSLLLEVYNPYNSAIPLSKLRFGVAYLNDYKQVKEVKGIEIRPVLNGTDSLKAQATTSFRFMLPEPGVPDPGYFKVTIAENGLLWGLNGNNVKLGSWKQ